VVPSKGSQQAHHIVVAFFRWCAAVDDPVQRAPELPVFCYKRILRTRPQHHICAPPGLVIYKTPFVTFAGIILGEQYLNARSIFLLL
jgi:hypothetical protein